MSKLNQALRAKYRTPRDAIDALGLDPSVLGADIVVGDSKEPTKVKKNPMTRQAALGVAVLASYIRRPGVLARDAKVDLGRLFAGVTPANYERRKKTIVKTLKPKLASDASIGEVAELLDLIDSHGVEADAAATESQVGTVSKMAPPLGEEKRAGADGEEELEELEEELEEEDDEDDDEEASRMAGVEDEDMPPFLKEKLSEDEYETVCDMIRGRARDEDPQERRDNEKAVEEMEETDDARRAKDAKRAKDTRRAKDAKRAKDEPPPFKGMPRTGGTMVDKKAMDAAIHVASDRAVQRTLELGRQIRAAEREVAPWVGDVSIAMDEAGSPEDVYKIALDALGVDVDDVHPSAWPTILRLQPLPGSRASERGRGASRSGAMDSASRASGLDVMRQISPDASRIKMM